MHKKLNDMIAYIEIGLAFVLIIINGFGLAKTGIKIMEADYIKLGLFIATLFKGISTGFCIWLVSDGIERIKE